MVTVGLSPKVPAQAIATIVAFIATYFGLDLDTEVSGAIAVIIGWIAGMIAKPGVVVDPTLPSGPIEGSDDALGKGVLRRLKPPQG